MNDTLVGKIVQQKLLAEAKYPNFAEKPNYSIQSTLDEEVLEVLEAAGEERWEDCMMELAQVGSVVLRAMEWVQNNKLNKETTNA